MTGTLKGLVPAAAGGFTVALVASHLGFALWWLGFPIGMAVTYLAFAPGETAWAIREAWRRTVAWQPDRVWWRRAKAAWIYLLAVIISLAMAVVGAVLMVVATVTLSFNGEAGAMMRLTEMAGFLGLIAGSFSVSFSALAAFDVRDRWTLRQLVHLRRSARSLHPLNVLRRIVGVAANIPTRIAAGWKRTWTEARVVGRFLFRVYVLVHTQERKMCTVDAALGGGIGYLFFTNPVAGALLGALFWTVNSAVVTPWLGRRGYIAAVVNADNGNG